MVGAAHRLHIMPTELPEQIYDSNRPHGQLLQTGGGTPLCKSGQDAGTRDENVPFDFQKMAFVSVSALLGARSEPRRCDFM